MHGHHEIRQFIFGRGCDKGRWTLKFKKVFINIFKRILTTKD